MRLHTVLALSLFLVGCGTSGSADDSDSSGDSGTSDSGTTDSGSSGGCDSWLVTYDLTGSTFNIDASFDFEIVLQEPYDADDNMGPGSMTLRFADVGGAPAAGPMAITDYQLTQNFVTGVSGLAEVTTDLENTGADSCGLTTGTLAGTTATWAANSMDPVCQDGQISCEGSFCGSSGAPAADSPTVIDNVCAPFTIAAFEFASDLSSFTMPSTVVASDSNQTTSMAYTGTQTAAVLDSATPSCYCD